MIRKGLLRSPLGRDCDGLLIYCNDVVRYDPTLGIRGLFEVTGKVDHVDKEFEGKDLVYLRRLDNSYRVNSFICGTSVLEISLHYSERTNNYYRYFADLGMNLYELINFYHNMRCVDNFWSEFDTLLRSKFGSKGFAEWLQSYCTW